jgi:hypothetical protein
VLFADDNDACDPVVDGPEVVNCEEELVLVGKDEELDPVGVGVVEVEVDAENPYEEHRASAAL